MPRWKPRQPENRIRVGRFKRWPRSGCACGKVGSLRAIGGIPLVLYLGNLAVLCAWAFLGFGFEISYARELDPDRTVYARAVEFCRATAKRPMALDFDKRVLCFDGEILPSQNLSLAESLEENGLFVVRSFGGNAITAIALADLLRNRRATVVVYDYCFSACASYLLLASEEALVLENSLVAWHFTPDPRWCPSLVESKDGGPRRLEQLPCADAPPEYQSGYREFRLLNEGFYSERAVDPRFEAPPESFAVRRTLRGMLEGTGALPDVFWTWNPRYCASTIRTRITYDAYPKSQAEVDEIAARLRLLYRVVYDP